MGLRSGRNKAHIYGEQQVKRILVGSGLDVENEVGSDFIVFCPFHSNHRTPAGEVDKETGMFFCFSCHKHAEIVELVMHVSGRTYFEAARFIKSKETEQDISAEIGKKLVKKPDYEPYDIATIRRLHEQAMQSERAMSYYNGRQITKQSVEKFGLGYSEKQDMVTIPIYAPDGVPVGFVGRSVEGKDFKNTPKLPKSKVLFNFHRVKTSNEVYVVESSFDAIRLDQCGMPAVATLGSMVSNFQIDLLRKYFNNVYVVADNDEAGGHMAERLQKSLGGVVSVVQLDKQYKDIGDMSDDVIKTLQVSFDTTIEAMLN